MDAFSGAGAVRDNTKYAPLTMDRYITGIVTQRSPLRDAMVPYLQAKFYQAGRFDSLWNGLNMELNSKSNLARRYGCTVYNSQDFPPINRFTKHNIVVDGVSSIRVVVDTAATVYDATGPSTQLALFTKSAGAGSTYFQSVGNTLYFSNGIDRKKWTVPTQAWKPTKLFAAGTLVLDSNNNLQQAVGGYTVSIPPTPPTGGVVNIQNNVLTIELDPNDPNLPDLDYATGTKLTLSGFDISTFLNGQTVTLLKYPGPFPNPNIITATFVHASYSGFDTTGHATSGNGITGATAPAWATAYDSGVVDAGAQWLYRGPSVTDWGTDGPTIAPTANQAVLPSTMEKWAANTFYSAIPYICPLDGGSGITIQKLTTAGTTAASIPSYSITPGVVTANGSANYTCIAHVTPFLSPGDGNWTASTVQKAGDVIAVITPSGQSALMLCIQAGTTGATLPVWNDSYGNLKTDNNVVWQNYGRPPFNPPNSTLVSKAGQILDENGFIETVYLDPSLGAWGTSGGTVPTWPMIVGNTTEENPSGLPLYWLNSAQFSPAFTSPVTYWYSFRNPITGTESNLSPASVAISKLANDQIQVQGFGSADPQDRTVRVYRTPQGGSSPLFVADLPMPTGGTSGIWTYNDASVDADLNVEIQGAQNEINDRPPVGLGALTYHVGRVWGAVNNLVYFDTGPDEGATDGEPDEAWSPGNVFAYPDPVTRLVPVTINNGGLLVFTTSDLYVILGTGTPSNPFYTTLYGAGIGLLGYDALDVVGATIHMHTTASKQISLDPSAGYVETGQPIGDQFKKVTTGGISAALYSPASTYCTWHEAESGDTGLYVSDGSVGWFRYSPITAPETGFLWSPRAAIEGGTSAVQSIETSPGHKQLLIGPPHAGGPILARDTSVNSDNEVPYSNAYADIGSIQLCQPYEIAEVAGVVVDSEKVGTPPTIGLLFGETRETASVKFTMYKKSSDDPPLIPASETLNGDRFVMMQNGKCPKHRHIQLRIQLSVEDEPNEILTHTVFGSISIERKATGANA